MKSHEDIKCSLYICMPKTNVHQTPKMYHHPKKKNAAEYYCINGHLLCKLWNLWNDFEHQCVFQIKTHTVQLDLRFFIFFLFVWINHQFQWKACETCVLGLSRQTSINEPKKKKEWIKYETIQNSYICKMHTYI